MPKKAPLKNEASTQFRIKQAFNRKAYLAKLSSSGIALSISRKLKFEMMDGARAGKLGGGIAARAGFRIPYFTLRGKPDGFFRFRFLEDAGGFAAFTKTGRQRYAQPKDTPPRAYFPPLVPWEKISKSATLPLVITEGELKSACACAMGIPTIGLGGVDAWRSSKRGIRFLPELADFNWKERRVAVAFDSDIRTKPDVQRAYLALATELTKRGALVFDVDLTNEEHAEEKIGLDDFLVRFGKTAFLDRHEKAAPFKLSQALYAMNQEFAVLLDSGNILNLRTGERYGYKTFTEVIARDRTWEELRIQPDKTQKIVVAALAKSWLEWPLRLKLQGTTYAPGEGVVANAKYNLWKGWGVEPKRGDTKPWRDLLAFIFSGHPDRDARMRWFEQWCAFPLRYPGSKMYSGVLIWGTKQGTGKSLIGYTLGRIYGENFSEISPLDLHDNYNDWRAGKQFVFGDEIAGGAKKADGDYLKRLITSKEIRVSKKYVAGYTVPDMANYFFTSNHPDPLHLEVGDRRFFVNEVRGEPLSPSFYRHYDGWLKSAGPAALFERLLSIDLAGFNPLGDSPFTPDKQEMADISQSDVELWANALVQSPRSVLGDFDNGSDLWTAAQLAEIYNAGRVTRMSVSSVARALVTAGTARVGGAGLVTYTSTRGLIRLHAIRNIEKWRNEKDPSKFAAHYEKYFENRYKQAPKY